METENECTCGCRIEKMRNMDLRRRDQPEPAARKFNEDMIRRNDIPRDAFGLIHDLCYDHEGRDRWQYMERAQKILAQPEPAAPRAARERESYRKGQEDMKLRALEEISSEGYGHATGDMLERILESVSALAALSETQPGERTK
jgi:hypothetical protein